MCWVSKEPSHEPSHGGAGADPAFLDRGTKFTKGVSIC